PMSLPTRWWTTKLATGDLDEDGLPDLAVTKWEDGTVDVFLNRGNRTFSTPQTLIVSVPGTHGNASAIQLVDVNADSHLDLLASTVNGGGIAVFVGDGTGAFASPTWLDNVLHPFAFAIGNFDADADPELAAGDWQKLHIA